MTATVARLSRAKDIVFGRTFELSLVKNYVSRWGLAQAVRELIQNALDSDSPFVYEFILDHENLNRCTLRLNSSNTTLAPHTLLLGATGKANDEDAIGSFGEGYKIALLVLTRMGYDVDLLNGDLVWKPKFRFNKMFGEEILCIDESYASDRTNKGLTWLVHGLSPADVEAVKESCLMMQDNIGQIKRTSYGDILLDRPGKLYVGSLYICDTELKYGYNIKPAHLRLERDRQTVSSWSLKDITLKCWYETDETAAIASMIAESVPDVEYAQFGAPELVKDECYRLFKERNPGAVVAKDQEELQKLVKSGLERVVVIGGAYHYAVTKSRKYISTAPKTVLMSPTATLSKWLTANRGEMRAKAIIAFKELINQSEGWKNK